MNNPIAGIRNVWRLAQENNANSNQDTSESARVLDIQAAGKEDIESRYDLEANNAKEMNALYNSSWLAAAIVDKIQSLIWQSDWTLADPSDTLLEAWNVNLPVIKKAIKELLVTGTLVVEPLVNTEVSTDIRLHVKPSENVTVDEIDEDYGDVKELTVGEDSQPASVINNERIPNEDGQVFLFRLNHRGKKRYGSGILTGTENIFYGLQQMIQALPARAKLLQNVIYVATNLAKGKRKQKDEKFDLFKEALLEGATAISLSTSEKVDILTPQTRASELDALVRLQISVALAKFNLPPALFGLTDDTNRATIEEVDEQLENKYGELQTELVAAVQTMVDWIARKQGGNGTQYLVIPSTIREANINDEQNTKATQFAVLQTARDANAIDEETHKTLVREVLETGQYEFVQDQDSDGE